MRKPCLKFISIATLFLFLFSLTFTSSIFANGNLPDLVVRNISVCYDPVIPPQFPGWIDNTYSISFNIVNQGNERAGSSRVFVEVMQGTYIASKTLSVRSLASGETANFNTQIRISRPPADGANLKTAVIFADSWYQIVESNEFNNRELIGSGSIGPCSPPPSFTGEVFCDLNNNGTRESGENVIPLEGPSAVCADSPTSNNWSTSTKYLDSNYQEIRPCSATDPNPCGDSSIYDGYFSGSVPTDGNYFFQLNLSNSCSSFVAPREQNKSYNITDNLYIQLPVTVTANTPSNLSPSGTLSPEGNYTLTWDTVPGATYYALRIDDEDDGWSGTCAWVYGDDVCNSSLTANSYTYNFKEGHTYTWWVHAIITACGGWMWSGANTANVTVPVIDTPPVGEYEENLNSSCTAIGWACDADNFNQPIAVHFYEGGIYGVGNFIGATTANSNVGDDISANCGGNPAHRFSYIFPENKITRGINYEIYAYAIGIDNNGVENGVNPLLPPYPASQPINCLPDPSPTIPQPSPTITPPGFHPYCPI